MAYIENLFKLQLSFFSTCFVFFCIDLAKIYLLVFLFVLSFLKKNGKNPKIEFFKISKILFFYKIIQI